MLLEEKYDEICDEMWYIYCEKEVRMERLSHDRGYSDEKIQRMMANQLLMRNLRLGATSSYITMKM